MRAMVVALADLGEVISDRTIVLNIVRGLNEHLQGLGGWILRQKPLPSYDDVVADLCLEEIRKLAHTTPLASPLVAAPPCPPSSTPPRPPILPNRSSPPMAEAAAAMLAVVAAIDVSVDAEVATATPPMAGHHGSPPSMTRGPAPSSCGQVPSRAPTTFARPIHRP